MKTNKLLLFSSLTFLAKISLACSCSGSSSFCNSHTHYDLSASCIVVDTFQNGISLKILHLFHGNENKDTIKVWDLGGPYHMCNDSASDARAAFLGNIGDTLIIALPKIDTIKNSWDVVGDYRTPGFQCAQYKLPVINDKILGLVSGSDYCYYMNNCLFNYDYDSFLVDFPAKRLDCQTWLTIIEPSSNDFLTLHPNPAENELVIESSQRGKLAMVNALGQVVAEIPMLDSRTKIFTNDFSPGMYQLILQSEEVQLIQKLIIRN